MADPDDNFDQLGDATQQHIRKLLREGKVEFSDEARASIAAKGMNEEDVVAMLVKASKSAN